MPSTLLREPRHGPPRGGLRPLHGDRTEGDPTSPWSNTRLWMIVPFSVAVSLAAIVLLVVGAGQRGTDDALLVTGRLSFLLFWPAYAGSATAALFGPAFRALQRHARDFGLAFAAAHLVHMVLVAWLCYLGAAPPLMSFIVFGIALFWTYLLAILSMGRFQRMVGRRGWKVVRTVGLNYIAYAFAADFLRVSAAANSRYLAGYLPFIILAVAGPVLRIGAWARRLAFDRKISVWIDKPGSA